jgi:purine-binding chemotaxis protein CheW
VERGVTPYLVVRAGGGQYGLPLADVREVLEVHEVVAVPGAHPAVRGVSPVHGRLIPRVDLGALLAGKAPQGGGAMAPTIVVVQGGERTVAFEVDEVDLAMQDDVLPLPATWEGPGAASAARHGDALIPLLEVGVLLARLEAAPGAG